MQAISTFLWGIPRYPIYTHKPIGRHCLIHLACIGCLKRAMSLYIDEDLICRCGYNLRGLPPSGKCPECGTPIHNAIATRQSAPPLVYRIVALAIETTTLFAVLMGLFGWTTRPEISHWSARKLLAQNIIDYVCLVGVLVVIASATFLSSSSRARKDKWVWLCLIISIINTLWLFDFIARP